MNDNLEQLISRRSFLRRGSCTALGLAGLASQAFTMRSIAAAMDGLAFNDYRALVCVFLFGGNDHGNTLMPFDRGEENFADYAARRGSLALRPDQVTGTLVTPAGLGGRRFALHPALADVRTLFEQGNAAVVANVGTLLEPLTKQQYRNGGALMPSQLFAHNEQQEQWQLSRPDARDGLGWGGRIADLLQANGANPNATVSMNISIAGDSRFLTGRDVTPYTIDRNGPRTLQTGGLGSGSEQAIVKQALLDMLAAQDDPMQPNQHAMRRAVADVSKRAVVNADLIQSMLSSANGVTTPVPANNGLAQQLNMVARLIQIGRASLGHQRQVFFVSAGGFDNHDGLIGTDATNGAHAGLLRQVNDALKFFWDALGNIGMRNSVTTFTASDFGRTLNSNGNGSDHAWGAHHIVMGGSQLAGRRIYGPFPSVRADGPEDVGQGRHIPGVSVDAYGFEFARWMGVPTSEMRTVFPNLSRFLDVNTPSSQLRMLLG